MALSRRDFLRRSGCGALSVAAMASGVDRLGMMQALAQGSGYKALVCIFLAGGNDGNNMVVPVDGGYAAYQAVRGPAGLAIGNNGGATDLLPMNPISIGHFGLHPNMPEL